MEGKTFYNFSKFFSANDIQIKDEICDDRNESENSIYIFEATEDFECAGAEVLVESSPPASPAMAARLAQPAQGAGSASPASSAVRDLIVIPELPNTIHLQHAIQQVTNAVVEVNGDSSGHSSPTADHTYITVASEGGNGVNYHVQYVEPQEIYTQQTHQAMESLRSYPVYGVAGVTAVGGGTEAAAEDAWGGASSADYTAYGVVVGADLSEAPSSPTTAGGAPVARMPPATVQWLLDHYETAEGVSLPRSTLYAHYLRHCTSHRLEPVNAASFGKLIRSVFVGLRTRRLGTRGNSKYHYYGIRAKPTPDHDEKTTVAEQPAVEGREREPEPPAGVPGVAYRQYLGVVERSNPPPLLLDELPADVTHEALFTLTEHHREFGVEFLEAVAALDTAGVERARRNFWRRPPADLCRRVMIKLTSTLEVADWLRRADLELYQKAVELLLPDVLRPIPPQLTQAIRNFAKGLESALAAGTSSGSPPGAPPPPSPSCRSQAHAAAALAGALRRYTSLNHLAQAATAVLTNPAQIHQMLSDLNRVDFRVVREQAAWACACGSASSAPRLEHEFKTTLAKGAALETWASWLEAAVVAALQPHEARPSADYTPRARRLLLDWSFYSSLVIRELTLRSAASFGSFHLLRLLYDEYVSYLIERRVANHTKSPPIAIMQRPLELTLEPEEARPEEEPEEEQWEWADDDEDDDEADCKRAKLQ